MTQEQARKVLKTKIDAVNALLDELYKFAADNGVHVYMSSIPRLQKAHAEGYQEAKDDYSYDGWSSSSSDC